VNVRAGLVAFIGHRYATRSRHTGTMALISAAAFLAVVAGALFSGAATVSADSACPNEAIREAQHAGVLPDCRAWEMVSPLDKNNGDIVADGLTTTAAKDGNAVAFNARTGFAGAIGAAVQGQVQYVARRGAGGWSTLAITPTAAPEDLQTFFSPTHLGIFSTDLRTAVLDAYDLPDATGDLPLRINLYTEDTATRELTTVTHSETSQAFPWYIQMFGFPEGPTAGVSDDAKHIPFVAEIPLLPSVENGPSSSAPNIYQWDNGTLSLAGILPDGSIPPEGSGAAFPNYRRDISADGSRLLFMASPTPGAQRQLYQRIDGSRTALISESENPSLTEEPQNVVLQAATPDGRNVFFVTDSPLLEEDTAPGPDVYRWTDGPDPAHERNLTLITNTGEYIQHITVGGGLVGSSDDGEVVYLQSQGNKLQVWNHGTLRTISEDVIKNPQPPYQLSATVSQPGFGRVAPDGSEVAFITESTRGLDGIHALTGQVTNGHFELYIYRLKTDQLVCASCPQQGPATADVRVGPSSNASGEPNVTSTNVFVENQMSRPEFLAEDGRVFFSTPEALVPEDTNGTLDAYQYDPETEKVSLLSSGRGSEPSAFLDASASGNDVFIATRTRLSGWDTDNLVDVYDVRTDGGFDEPERKPAPCSGEGCQPPGTALPDGPTVASTGSTRGNVPQSPRRCPHGKQRVRRKGKVRCVKRHHRAHAKSSTGVRRGGVK